MAVTNAPTAHPFGANLHRANLSRAKRAKWKDRWQYNRRIRMEVNRTYRGAGNRSQGEANAFHQALNALSRGLA